MTVVADVMLVEDDPTVRTAVGEYLRAAGFAVTEHGHGSHALDALRHQRAPDVIVLDRMLPGVTGDAFCQRVRAEHPQIPVLMLTALSSTDDRISGLESGADDYLTKPFSMRELQLRIEALMRRRSAGADLAPFSTGDFRVDPNRRRILRDGREIGLTTREYELLLFFLRHPGRVYSRDDILREVWGWTFGDASTVTVHVRRLREKIESEPRFPRHLLTEWGAGYRMVIGGEN